MIQQILQHENKTTACNCRIVGCLLASKILETNHAIIQQCIQNGIITDWFLFAGNCLRIAPSYISKKNSRELCLTIVKKY